MKTGLKKYLAVVTRSDYKVPSRIYTVKASTAAVAVKRAQLKAQADFPCYKLFDIMVETITPRKIKRFNRLYNDALIYLRRADSQYQWTCAHVTKELHRTINRQGAYGKKLQFGWCLSEAEWFKTRLLSLQDNIEQRDALAICRERLADSWLQMIELHDVINAE